jgi:hypothetical protein
MLIPAATVTGVVLAALFNITVYSSLISGFLLNIAILVN